MKMSLWRSTTFRLLMIYALVFSASMSALVYLNYWQSASYTAREADYNINWQFAYFSALPPQQVEAQLAAHIRSQLQRPVNFYGLFSPDRRWLAGDIGVFPSRLASNGVGVWGPLTLTGPTSGRPQYLRTRATRLPDGNLLVVSRDVGEMARLRETMLGGLAGSAAMVMLGGLGVGVLVSAAQLRRVKAVRSVAQRIADGDLDARLPAGGRDEISWLSQIVNHMLDEVSRLMHEVKGACDGIAHDLRTPLVHVRTHLARVPLDTLDGEHATLIEKASHGVSDVLKRFSAMLRISEIEAMRRRAGFGDVALETLCRELADLYQPLAADKAVELSLQLTRVSTVRADYALMFEALANLLDNAIKFTPPGGRVELRLATGAQGPSVQVSDNGPGIPDAERLAVFQRFYRSERTRETPGSGLGLSLVQAVMRMHGFGLGLEDARPGLRVTLDCWAYAGVATLATGGATAARSRDQETI
ncbi:MAG: HAMP domain-containing sensor histidine kinase [Paraburkholderia tropica]|uniref:histidine kinase n=1 Tax=Paraburkholderia tropica TaxID=92647 RepID=A0ABX5ME67_9BURK|nr:HAMP domain-containing sensor histidine kinase [Paraburkholderia tropica]MBB3005258.1 signal transduction histidine kinase [Paraburkholderia tropica]MBB6324187.1 signal transduction histidine kinase [Paraburkholderia tropica]MDE1140419.1 HAMP domain-containing sensor histidine kinase [Paraburkholderia tropica]PXX03304.1 signal transduction histidine kinase [Paraburkholderia tropica]PZW69264.1 signal transduction histidine kinase [Paraburkholderia tropica]